MRDEGGCCQLRVLVNALKVLHQISFGREGTVTVGADVGSHPGVCAMVNLKIRRPSVALPAPRKAALVDINAWGGRTAA